MLKFDYKQTLCLSCGFGGGMERLSLYSREETGKLSADHYLAAIWLRKKVRNTSKKTISTKPFAKNAF